MWFYEELVLELALFMCFFENWYWYWNCLYNDWRIGIDTGIVYTMSEELVLGLELFIQWLKTWYWYWNCLHNDWRIGIGTGIVYTMTEELVLVLELFILCLKNWYWYWNCLYYVWRIGTGIDPKKVVLPISVAVHHCPAIFFKTDLCDSSPVAWIETST